MIERDLDQAEGVRFDLAIVGGGIYGVALALEASRRGLRPVLVERGDFGAETSWNSLRIVHGGLRYLQTLDLIRFHESVRERSWLLRNFPDQVEPLSCLMPLYGDGFYRPVIFRLALAANDFLSRRRNLGLRPDRRLERGRVLSVAETLKRLPSATRAGLKGAALWHDAAMPLSQRLLIEMLHWANACGAVTLNYVEARDVLTSDREKDQARVVEGLVARDRATGKEFELSARVVVNCAGPWCREVAQTFDRDLPDLFHRSLALNLLIDRDPPAASAVAVKARREKAQTFFLVPWKGKMMAGTLHLPLSGTGKIDRVDEDTINRFIADLNDAHPALELDSAAVLRVLWGFLPAAEPNAAAPAVRPVIRHHASDGGPRRLFSISGVKFTTARDVAEKALRVVVESEGHKLAGYGPTPRPEPVRWPTAEELLELAERKPEEAARGTRELMKFESALNPEDVILRRTDWSTDPKDAQRFAALLPELLGRTPERPQRVIQERR